MRPVMAHIHTNEWICPVPYTADRPDTYQLRHRGHKCVHGHSVLCIAHAMAILAAVELGRRALQLGRAEDGGSEWVLRPVRLKRPTRRPVVSTNRKKARPRPGAPSTYGAAVAMQKGDP